MSKALEAWAKVVDLALTGEEHATIDEALRREAAADHRHARDLDQIDRLTALVARYRKTLGEISIVTLGTFPTCADDELPAAIAERLARANEAQRSEHRALVMFWNLVAEIDRGAGPCAEQTPEAALTRVTDILRQQRKQAAERDRLDAAKRKLGGEEQGGGAMSGVWNAWRAHCAGDSLTEPTRAHIEKVLLTFFNLVGYLDSLDGDRQQQEHESIEVTIERLEGKIKKLLDQAKRLAETEAYSTELLAEIKTERENCAAAFVVASEVRGEMDMETSRQLNRLLLTLPPSDAQAIAEILASTTRTRDEAIRALTPGHARSAYDAKINAAREEGRAEHVETTKCLAGEVAALRKKIDATLIEAHSTSALNLAAKEHDAALARIAAVESECQALREIHEQQVSLRRRDRVDARATAHLSAARPAFANHVDASAKILLIATLAEEVKRARARLDEDRREAGRAGGGLSEGTEQKHLTTIRGAERRFADEVIRVLATTTGAERRSIGATEAPRGDLGRDLGVDPIRSKP